MMMKKTKNYLMISLICLCAVFAALAVGFGGIVVSYADEPSVNDSGLSELYNYGETVSLPIGADIEYKGKKTNATKTYLVYPDGSARSKSEYVLDDYGCYDAVFEGTIDGVTVVAKKQFTVKKSYYSVSDDSSIDFGDLNKSFVNMGYRKGLKLTLAEGGTFYYNKPVNIYENSRFDLIYFNCLQFDTICKSVTVRLTDCYDSSKFVDLHYNRGNYDYQTYVNVSAYGKKKAGLSKAESGNVEIDGENYSLVNSFNNSDGTIITGNLNVNKNYYNFGFILDTTDRKNIRVYVNHTNGSNTALVSELNNRNIYDYDFDGFTDGNVYISVTASGLVGVNGAPVEIAKIMDDDNGSLAYADYCEDVTAPIFIEENAFSQRKIVANGDSIKVPVVYTYDDSGVRGGNVADYVVWYNRGTAAERMIKVENGKFLPTAIGKYTIEYTAVDYFKNVGKYVIVLNATKNGEDGISFDVENTFDGIEAGTRVKFDNYSVSGINGEVLVTIEVTNPKGETKELSATDEYLIEYSGEYKVRYLYEDVLYSGSEEMKFTAVNSSKPAFDSSVMSLNRYYIKGYTYSIEANKAYTYDENGATPANVEAYVKFDGGEYEKIEDIGNVTINANNTVRFKLKCENSDVEIVSDEIKVVDVKTADGKLDITKFFAGNVASASTDRNGTTVNVTSNGTIEFINPLQFNKAFNFRFMLPSDDAATKMSIVITDYYDAAKTLKIDLSGNNAYSINGGTGRTLLNPWKGYTTNVAYADGLLRIGDTEVNYNSIFESGLCFLKVVFENKNTTSITVNELCTQSLANVYSDNMGPIMYYKELEKVAAINSEITIPRPYAADVLSPSSMADLKMTVYKNNKVMKAVSGETLENITDFTKEYKILLDDYGVYKVIYEYSDQYGNVTEQTYSRFTISVTDIEAPVITVNEDISKPISVGVNTEVPAVNYSVNDNYTAANRLTVWVVVKDGFNTVSAVRDAKTIYLSKAGNYTVYIYCKDGAGNTAYVSYKVTAR